ETRSEGLCAPARDRSHLCSGADRSAFAPVITLSTAEITSAIPTRSIEPLTSESLVRRSPPRTSQPESHHGRQTSGLDEPKTATIGHPTAAAMCISPLSLPTNSAPNSEVNATTSSSLRSGKTIGELRL